VLIRAHDVHPIGPLTSPTLLIQEGDRLLVRCLAPAVPALRKVGGLIIRPDASDAPARRDDTGAVKVMVEATIGNLSPLDGMSLADALASDTMSGAHVWAIREMAGNELAAARTRRPSRDSHETGSPAVQPTLADPDSALMTWHRDTGSVIREFSLVASSPEYYSEGEAKQPSDQLAHLLPGSTGFSSRQQSLPLTVGTVLLVEAPNSWVWAHRATSAFAHLKRITDAAAETTAAGRPFWPPKKADVIKKLRIAACLSALVTLLCLSAFEIVDLFPLALAISAAFIFIGAMTLDQAWRAINYRVLLVVACSFGPGKALTNTGLAKFAGVALMAMTSLGTFGFLFMIVLFTSLLTSIVSNSTAVITIYAILRTMKVPGISMEAMMCCMCLGASTDYITPIGYQTNLMVYKRGGYAFSDYTKVGAGLTILNCVTYAGMAMIAL
jgi:hypothetical protein